MKKVVTRKICLNCGHEFIYKERFQSMYRLFWRMNCKKCGARYSVLVRYRFAVMALLALPVAFGPSLFVFLEWNVWSVLIAEVIYFTSWAIVVLFALPLLPLKLDLANDEVTEELNAEK